MGFSKPSKIQERALPLLLSNPCVSSAYLVLRSTITQYLHRPQNMIGQSQSGTGKTAAFVLTMLSRVDYFKEKPQVSFHSSAIWLLSNKRHHVKDCHSTLGALPRPIARARSTNHVCYRVNGQIHVSPDRVRHQGPFAKRHIAGDRSSYRRHAWHYD